jgi:hypothetical protein
VTYCKELKDLEALLQEHGTLSIDDRDVVLQFLTRETPKTADDDEQQL